MSASVQPEPSARVRRPAGNVFGRWAAERVLNHLVGPRDTAGRRPVVLEKFGIDVRDERCRTRIRAILDAFFSGLEYGIKSPSGVDLPAERITEVAPLLRPFYGEGRAMGFGAKCLLRLRGTTYTLARFETEVTGAEDPFIFLRYVGLGFWLGFRHGGRSGRLDEAAGRLARRGLRHLVHDGYGFQVGFFVRRKSSRALERLRSLSGFARAAAFNGLGRSLWFFSMDRPAKAIDYAQSLGDDRDAVLGGLGLAAAFTFPDDLGRAYDVATGLSTALAPAFRKGVRIALYVRHRCDQEYLETCFASLPRSLSLEARSDLEWALHVAAETESSPEFIERFHAGCLDREGS